MGGGHGQRPQQPFFQYSQCLWFSYTHDSSLLLIPRAGTGRRKALLIGINYFNTSSALRGCINDAHNVQKFLIGTLRVHTVRSSKGDGLIRAERYHYKQEDIVMLTDDSRNPRQIPTRANMIQAMNWLVQGARPDDALFFH